MEFVEKGCGGCLFIFDGWLYLLDHCLCGGVRSEVVWREVRFCNGGKFWVTTTIIFIDIQYVFNFKFENFRCKEKAVGATKFTFEGGINDLGMLA
jgi:hypothetical protein